MRLIMTPVVTTFPAVTEFAKACQALDDLHLPYEIVQPGSAYARVGVPGIVLDAETRAVLTARHRDGFTCSGWVDYRPSSAAAPQEAPPEFAEDIFGQARIMVLAPCVADVTKIRLIVHLSGDLAGVMPYWNAQLREASFNPSAATLTYMEQYRFIVLYPRRIAVAKADDLVDGWRVLESIRRRANEIWARRAEIEPSYERREKPPALEIYKRLPRTNCGACGQKTCLAFAVAVYMGGAPASRCPPVFGGQFSHLKDALVEICAGLGAMDAAEDASPGVSTSKSEEFI
jgi:ArsR family metal-binding transcriptional regulator